jgi:endonuclease/exonuclease/phosphatase family metal-dependent hydrolase
MEFVNEKWQIRTVSYNIAGNHSSFDIDKIISVLENINADVICLQEVGGTSISNTHAHVIANQLRMFCVFEQAHQSRYPFGNAILSRFPMTHCTRIELPRGSLHRDDGSRMPGQNETRVAVSVQVCPFQEHPQFDFVCICTHLGIYNSADRVTGGSAIEPFDRIRAHIKPNDHLPALLIGDFNIRYDSQHTESGLQAVDRNWNIYGSEPTAGNKKIDYICDRGRGKWTMGEQYVVSDEVTGRASDHRPLCATWSVNPDALFGTTAS